MTLDPPQDSLDDGNPTTGCPRLAESSVAEFSVQQQDPPAQEAQPPRPKFQFKNPYAKKKTSPVGVVPKNVLPQGGVGCLVSNAAGGSVVAGTNINQPTSPQPPSQRPPPRPQEANLPDHQDTAGAANMGLKSQLSVSAIKKAKRNSFSAKSSNKKASPVCEICLAKQLRKKPKKRPHHPTCPLSRKYKKEQQMKMMVQLQIPRFAHTKTTGEGVAVATKPDERQAEAINEDEELPPVLPHQPLESQKTNHARSEKKMPAVHVKPSMIANTAPDPCIPLGKKLRNELERRLSVLRSTEPQYLTEKIALQSVLDKGKTIGLPVAIKLMFDYIANEVKLR